MIGLAAVILQVSLLVAWWRGVRKVYSPERRNVGTPPMNVSAAVALVLFQSTGLSYVRDGWGVWVIVLGSVAELAMCWFILTGDKVGRP